MNISPRAEFLIGKLNNLGFEAYLVGGCVRDLIMGKNAHDWDITTNAKPEQIMDVFSDLTTIPTGISHGTVTVLFEKEPFELTTYRTEGDYTDHRRPDSVTFVSDLREDVSRRDFTINAICYSPNSGIVDYFGGMEDIKRGIIRTVGDAKKRFDEDALRILRALRFSATLGFKIETETLIAAKECAQTLKSIAKERITDEFLKLILGKDAEKILPLTSEILEIEINWQGISALPENPIIRMAHLFAENERGLLFFRLSNAQKKAIKALLNYEFCGVRELVRDLGELAPLYLDLKGMEKGEYEEIIEKNLCCSVSQLEIDGRDLMALGYRGKQIKETLNFILDKVMKNEIANEKEGIIEFLKG